MFSTFDSIFLIYGVIKKDPLSKNLWLEYVEKNGTRIWARLHPMFRFFSRNIWIL